MSGELTRLSWAIATTGKAPRGALREIWYAALSRIPGGDPAYERRRHPQRAFVLDDPRTLVVDGHAGCGNSWTWQVVRAVAGDRPIAHHRHRAAQILEGARRGLATICVIRDPVDAIASQAARYPSMLDIELMRFEYFYSRCWPVAPRTEVVTFEQSTASPASVIDRLNHRFGCDLPRFDSLGPDIERRLIQHIEQDSRGDFGDDATVRGALPSEARRMRTEQLKDALSAPALAPYRRRCEEVFKRYDELARSQAVRAGAGG